MPLFRRNAGLRQRASEFNGRYWRSAIQVTSTNWEGRRAAVHRATDAEKRLRALRGEWHMGLKHLVVQYSAGVSVDEIGDVAESVAASYRAWVTSALSHAGPSPRLSDGNEYYTSILQLLGITTGCGRDDSARTIVESVIRQGADPLFSALASAHRLALPSGSPAASTPRVARPLLAVLQRPEEADRTIQTYLTDWPTRMKSMSWMGSLERVEPGDSYGQGFIGYWAMELPAVASAIDAHLDDVVSPFLPADLL